MHAFRLTSRAAWLKVILLTLNLVAHHHITVAGFERLHHKMFWVERFR